MKKCKICKHNEGTNYFMAILVCEDCYNWDKIKAIVSKLNTRELLKLMK